jgi:hypothetical protein
VALGDTRGLETAKGEAQAGALRDALAALGPRERPDLAWLVLNAEAGRAHAGAGTLAALADALQEAGVPALVVLTHAEAGEGAHAGLRARVADVLGPLPVIAVNARETRGEDGMLLVPAHGLEMLRAASEAVLPTR